MKPRREFTLRRKDGSNQNGENLFQFRRRGPRAAFFQDRIYLVTAEVAAGKGWPPVAAGAAVAIVGRNPDKLAAAVKDIEALKTERRL